MNEEPKTPNAPTPDEPQTEETPPSQDGEDSQPTDPTPTFLPVSKLPWTLASEAPIWKDRLIVLGLACLALLPFLGSFGLWDPWETHYGEVGRQITERNDWISTWWGSHWKNGTGGSEGTFFFSKPIFLMWLMAMGLEVFGFSEWGIRLGVCMIAITAVVMGYSMGQRIWNRRVGYIFALVLCTSPFFFFLSRQAQTDMPFVGNMTIGLCFFMMAIFGKHRERQPTKRALLFTLLFSLIAIVPQLVIIGTGLGWRSAPHISSVRALFYWGPFQVFLYATLLIAVGVSILRSRKLTERTLLLMGFYIFTGFASISKGLLGFALPGAFIFFFLLLTGHWKRLKEMELLRGIPIFIAAAFPWYVGMLVRHGNAFYQRFFIHDHFKRLATGVHQIDSGSFEHYIKWMFYGLWPWGSFLPAAFARLFTQPTTPPTPPPANDSTEIDPTPSHDDTHHATLFLIIWLTFTFSLFTLASTKFHHYIFPAIPAAAFLTALTIYDLIASRSEQRTRPVAFILLFSALSFFAIISWDLFDDPQHLKNLFTYKYDRKWDPTWTTSLRPTMLAVILTATPGILLLTARSLKIRRIGLSILSIAAAFMLFFSLNVYMPKITISWSQKGIWDAYYSMCTPSQGPPGHDAKKRYCKEQALSYKLNWRGETYYTQNEVIPIRNDKEFKHFLSQNQDQTFYAIMEYSRWNGDFKRKLPARFKGRACAVYDKNIKFVLVQTPCQKGPSKP